MKKMNPVIHFEMPASDKSRMIKFYEKAFGWKMQQLGPEMGNYVVVSTTETDEKNRPKTPGAINGGFFEKSNDNQYPSVVIAVDDIGAAIKDVTAAGGQVVGGHNKDGQPDEIPGVGLYASFIDTEGNRVSMLQPMGM
jgi:predicted enzyme related to lactoylglutathione lyase